MKTKLFLIALPVLFLTVFFTTCTKDKGGLTAPMYVRMTDSPGDYQAVNVDVKSVQVHTDDGGWVNLQTNTGVYNLITLSNGIDVLIADGEIPIGNVSQIRLVLGPNNSVQVNEVVFPLIIPSGMESGIKLDVHTTLTANVPFNILLDFDAAQSIVLTGSGTYELKPVIRTIVTSAYNGSIKGTVYPAEATPAVVAKAGMETYSTYANSSGSFSLRGLPVGTYDVTFYPKQPYLQKIISGVTVQGGATTDLGTVNFFYRGE